MGLKFAGFSISISNPVPCTPSRLRIHAVTVVPTLEPKITPMACCSVMTPLLTKPTTITVVAPELWITAVTAIPSKKTLQGIAGKGAQDLLELATGLLLQGLAHGIHAKQEHCKAAQQTKYMEYIQLSLSSLLYAESTYVSTF